MGTSLSCSQPIRDDYQFGNSSVDRIEKLENLVRELRNEVVRMKDAPPPSATSILVVENTPFGEVESTPSTINEPEEKE